MNKDMVTYYKQRAAEYEKIYARPERHGDLAQASAILKTIFVGKNVFEIACGTGYWTQSIAETANSILGIDINPEVLDIARQKQYSGAAVSFAVQDFNNYKAGSKYEALFGGFIWSHIELQQLDSFLNRILSYVSSGATVVFMDNNFVEGSSNTLNETDEYGNTYQYRKLEDGSEHRVLKNFPTEVFIRSLLIGRATDIEFVSLRYFWLLKFRTCS